MTTIEEMRLQEEQRVRDAEIEARRLKEEILCACVIFSPKMASTIGVPNLTMKMEDLPEFIENEMSSADVKKMTFKVRFLRRTNRWIESLPDADI